jgi:predicted ABC-type ATPase
VLSTPKYRKLVRIAKRKRFEILLFYVLLQSPQLHVARVRLRVRKGGHDVPVSKILGRRKRSLAQLPWFLQQADRAWLYDNSGARPHLMGLKQQDQIVLDHHAALPEIRQIVEQLARKSAIKSKLEVP